jgi:hypothetical protein
MNLPVVIDRMDDCLAMYQRSTLGEEAFGEIKMLTRLEHTNPSIGTDKMNDYQAMYHEISCAQCISFVRTP